MDTSFYASVADADSAAPQRKSDINSKTEYFAKEYKESVKETASRVSDKNRERATAQAVVTSVVAELLHEARLMEKLHSVAEASGLSETQLRYAADNLLGNLWVAAKWSASKGAPQKKTNLYQAVDWSLLGKDAPEQPKKGDAPF